MPVLVMWPDSATKRCTEGETTVDECPGPSEPLFGQDGNYRIAVPSYTERDGTVTDAVTGLVWEKVTESAAFTMADAREHCATLATQQLGGLATWRLPTLRELESILDLGRYPAFPEPIAPHQSGYYLSATPVAASSAFPFWVMRAANAITVGFDESAHSMRAVCVGGETRINEVELRILSDWVLDRSTGLWWQRESGSDDFSWDGALSYCESLELSGYTDWRLPSAKELLSIVDTEELQPALDRVAFPGEPPGKFWSSTPVATSGTETFIVDFAIGDLAYSISSAKRRARCVRSDPPPDP
ncbi:DUF1566 domain-containing protein [Sorangium sp. So ce1335]|uniref:Lcl C-terminal domain-containing protein n=1 Tax=Sorangium sp. So ce1335 TaxID=3133335 RepID=UPI003F63AEC8